MKLKNKKLNYKNPYIYDYGYHITSQKNLNTILKNGLKLIKFHFNDLLDSRYSPEEIKILYNGYNPIHFLTSLDLNNYGMLGKNLINRGDYILKINVKKFEQLIDLGSLNERNIRLNKQNLTLKYEFPHNIYPLLQKYFNRFSGQIPLIEFKRNNQLIIDVIETTQTFCIAEDIPNKYIEEVVKI